MEDTGGDILTEYKWSFRIKSYENVDTVNMGEIKYVVRGIW